MRNVSLRRQQDSESVCDQLVHLDGYQGNVRCHPNCVDISASPDSVPVVHLRQVEEANRSGGGAAQAILMSQQQQQQEVVEARLGPQAGMTETAVKFISTSPARF